MNVYCKIWKCKLNAFKLLYFKNIWNLLIHKRFLINWCEYLSKCRRLLQLPVHKKSVQIELHLLYLHRINWFFVQTSKFQLKRKIHGNNSFFLLEANILNFTNRYRIQHILQSNKLIAETYSFFKSISFDVLCSKYILYSPDYIWSISKLCPSFFEIPIPEVIWMYKTHAFLRNYCTLKLLFIVRRK